MRRPARGEEAGRSSLVVVIVLTLVAGLLLGGGLAWVRRSRTVSVEPVAVVTPSAGATAEAQATAAGAPTSDAQTITSEPSYTPGDPGPVVASGKLSTKTEGGDAAYAVVSLHRAVPVASLNDSALQTCSAQLDSDGTWDRTIVVPVTVEAKVTSSLPATLAVQLRDEPVVSTPGTQWVVISSNGPDCVDQSTFQVKFDDQTPRVAKTLVAFLLVRGARTPRDPNGATSAGGVTLDGEVIVNEEMPDQTWTGKGVSTGDTCKPSLVYSAKVYTNYCRSLSG